MALPPTASMPALQNYQPILLPLLNPVRSIFKQHLMSRPNTSDGTSSSEGETVSNGDQLSEALEVQHYTRK
jgi:hypothetical protein